MTTLQSNRRSHSEDDERHRFNSAFSELGLDWHWDERLYADLQTIPQARERVRSYVRTHRPHLLLAYDADFLADAIESVRARSRGMS